MVSGERIQSSPDDRTAIYVGSEMQSVLDGTLNGIQPFTCRLLVDRGTRQRHDSPDVITFEEYKELAADTVQALVLRGLRTAVYCGIGDQTKQFASAIGRRTTGTPDGTRPLKVGMIGNYLQSTKENTGTIRAFNRGRLEVLVASRLLETETSIRPDALVIATRIQSRRVLENVLLNASHADPEHPALSVIELLGLVAGQAGRSAFTTWDALGEDTIHQGKQLGGYLDSRPDSSKVFTLEHLPQQLQPKFEALDGSPVVAATRLSADAEDLEPLTPDLKPLEEVAAQLMPHLPLKSALSRLRKAGVKERTEYKEIGGELTRVRLFSETQAVEYFTKHPVPQIAGEDKKGVKHMARLLGVSAWLIDAAIEELGDQVTAEPLLHPSVLRERPYYDENAQQLIMAVASRRKAAHEAVLAAAAQRARAAPPPVEEGDVPLHTLAKQAGVSRSSAKEALNGVVDLPVRQPEQGQPAVHVLKDEVELALHRITPLPPPIHRIPSPAIQARLHHRTPRTIDKYLAEFPAYRRRQFGRGPMVFDRSWEALRHAEEQIGVPQDAIPILWEELPRTDTDVTKEQESYARAVQIMHMEPRRLGPAAIMSRETAELYLRTAYDVATGESWSEAAPAPDYQEERLQPAEQLVARLATSTIVVTEQPTPAEPVEPHAVTAPIGALPETEHSATSSADIAGATEPVVPAIEESSADEAQPQEPQPVLLAEYAARFNTAQGGEVTGGDFARIAEAIGAEVRDEGNGPYLTVAGRQTMDAYVARLQPAPEDWIRVLDCVKKDIPRVSFHTVNDYLTDLGSSEGVGDFQVRRGSLGTARFVSPERAAMLRERFGQSPMPAFLAPAQPPTSAPSRRRSRQQPATQGPEAPPRLPPGTQALQGSNPLSLPDIVERTGRDPAAVREAIGAARELLGPKKFKAEEMRDRYGVLTAHFSDPLVLTAIEDHLMGVHPAALAHRLNVREPTIHKFLDDMGYTLTDEGRVHGEALEALFEYFPHS